MSIASISTITASLVLFGIFIVITSNIQYNSKMLLFNQPEIQVFCDFQLDETQLSAIYEQISKNPDVEKCDVVSKQDAFKKTKQLFGDDKTLFDEINEDFLPVSFIVKLKTSQNSSVMAEEFKKIKGVDYVSYSEKTVYFITMVIKWIKYFSAFLMIIFSVFSIMIISNTVRLAMLSRSKEINIMKYIGATDWFIRWPFLVEGIIIGIIGSLIGFFAITAFYRYLMLRFTEFEYIFKFVDIKIIANEILVVYFIIGVVVGTLGSAISIRKYLRV
jgi:cell division transport system permease protein